MSEKNSNERFLSYRGDIKALVAYNDDLYFVTRHSEEQATPLYRLNLDKETLHSIPLRGSSGKKLALVEGGVLIANTDEALERHSFGASSCEDFGPSLSGTVGGMAAVAGNRIAVLSGSLLLFLSDSGEETQRFDLEEECCSIAVSPDMQWVVVGTTLGTVAVFECEKKDNFVKGDAQKIHEGAVLDLLFDKEELRVFSAGTDCKLLLSHVRGRLDPEDRGGKSCHKLPITKILASPSIDFYTGSVDKSFKTWPGGLTGKRPYTISDGVGEVVDMALVHFKNRPHLAVVSGDSTIRVWDLEDSGRPKERSLICRDAMARAKYELGQKEPERREAVLKELSSYNDAASIEILGYRAMDDEEYSLRVLATKLLGEMGNPRALGALEQLLSSADEGVRLAALAGLRQLEGQESLRPLKLALKTAKKDIGLSAVSALEELSSSNDLALTELTKALELNPTEVRTAALQSLERLHGGEDNLPEAFLTGLRSSKADVRVLSLTRAFKCEVLADTGIQAALRRHGEDGDADTRHTAFLVSVLSQPKLAKALRERDSDLHRNIAELELHGQEIEEDEYPEAPASITVQPGDLSEADQTPLLQAMASRALDTCLRGATSLALLQDSRAFGTLLQLSRETDTQTRVEVCKALKNLNDPRGIERLRLMIRDSEASVRDSAFSALIQLEGDNPLEAAEAGLLAAHEDVRRRALQLLIEDIRSNMPTSKEQTSWKLLERALSDSFPEVRSEAFKAALNLQFAGGEEKTLRFVLQSLHRDIRNEAFVEIMAQIHKDWAWPLLLEMLRDSDPSLRREVFNYAMKRSKGRLIELLSAALDCPYSDLRAEATKNLNNCKEEGADALLFRALDDDDEQVRQLGLKALLNTGSPNLSQVMKSKYPDIRARAAYTRALEGDEESLIPLLQLVTEDEPEISDLKRKWQERVELALEGLAELGSPGALETLRTILGKDQQSIRNKASKAIILCSRPGNIEVLLEALRHSDSNVQMDAALGLAACGDTRGTTLLFGGQQSSSGGSGRTARKRPARKRGSQSSSGAAPSVGLRASLALGKKAENQLLSYLDNSQESVRHWAFTALMLLELCDASSEGIPKRCLAGLSAESPEIRMKAAAALESYSDANAFTQFVVDLCNESTEDKAWELDEKTVVTLGSALAKGDSMLRFRASRLLLKLRGKKQDDFDRAWDRFSRRYSHELGSLQATVDRDTTRPGMEETHRLVFGTYVGLSRLQDQNSAVQIRQGALRRLFEGCQKDPSLRDSVRPVLVLALGDSNGTVRKQAFEYLSELTSDVSELCSVALSSGQRDVGALGFQKLVAEGDEATSRKLLENVLKNNVEGLEFEAAKVLQKQAGEVVTYELAFEAKSEGLRKEAVQTLARSYEKPEAAEALRRALNTRYRGVKTLAATELAAKKDAAAFDVLKNMLKSDQRDEQRSGIKALISLGDERVPTLFLDRIDNDPAGSALHSDLFDGVGTLRHKSVLDRLLVCIRRNKRRDQAFEAAYKISGYDQPVEDDLAKPDWETKQHPRHADVLAELMDTCYRISDENKLTRLIPSARWCRTNEVEDKLATLSFFPKEGVRHAAVEALGWRSRERDGSVETLKKLLEHDDGVTRFLAAEGLALSGHKDGLSVLQASVELLPNVMQRKRAVKALGKLGDEQALDLLLRLINDTGHALQEEAAEALGHMSDSDQAENVFKTLSKLAEGSYGVALSAMTGLRWFGSMDAWAQIRGRSKDSSWMVRQHVAKLLAHDNDPQAKEILRQLIESDYDSDVLGSAVESLRKLCEEGSLEPDYAMVCSQQSYMVNQALERLKEKGDPVRLLEILPKVSDSYVNSVVDVLLARTPLPLAEAAKVLETSNQERTLRIASQILGRGGEDAKPYGASLAKACMRWQSRWDEERAKIPDGDRNLRSKMSSFTDTYCLMLWSCGRLGSGGEALIAATRPGYFTEIRESALTGLSTGLGGDDGIEALVQAVQDADAGIRALASSALTKLAPQRASELIAKVLDDSTSLSRLLEGVSNEESQPALRQAAATVHHQGVALPHLVVRSDIEGLVEAMSDSQLPEATRLGAIEGLGRVASVEAEEAIAGFASKDSEDEDLRKAAWRALRRSKRYRKKREALAAQQGEEG